ncbi:MAG: S8 family serine peptidase [Bacteroidia bacterium]|nr:S8 family serine peptidase [Bacteroidia bacterium]
MHKLLLYCALWLVCGVVATSSAQNLTARAKAPANAIEALDRIPSDAEVVPGRILVKFRREAEHLLENDYASVAAINPLLARYGVFRMTRAYPGHISRFRADGSEIALQRLYYVEFDDEAHPIDVARAFCRLPDVEYAEPDLVQKLCLVPNDPMFTQQYGLYAVWAREAWDISTGSPDVVIAIVDSGVRWTHEDLADNIRVNPGEDIDQDGKFTTADIDSVDNDGNGYVDDIIGIDFVGPTGLSGGSYYDRDPNPTSTGNPHGTHVAGIAAARGDNGKGIAGLAFNCRIMPIKCAPDRYSTSIMRGYDGIVYAADNGAHVINCSWGGGGYMLSQEERIAYAISKGAVVIAAAGNSGDETVSTPGAYPNVLSVANVGQGDKVHSSSTYGSWVNVSAPGVDIVSSISQSNTSYTAYTGTSMASPLVAGLAGLVKSVFPQFTPEQVREQIRVTSDTIDYLQNRWLKGKIGRGRVNAYRALTEQWPGVRLVDWSWSDTEYGNGNGIAERGEKLAIRMRWVNYLAPTTNAVIRLSSPNTRVTIEQGEFLAGQIPTMGEVSNDATPYVLTLEDVYAPNNQVDLIYHVTDGEYVDQGGVFFIQQPSYRDHDINDIQVTLSSDGNIGYDDMSGVTGSGFRYKGMESVLFEGAFMVGAVINNTPLVVDVARSGASAQARDMQAEYLYNMDTPGARAEQEGDGVFEDLGATLANRLQTRIRLESFAFTRPELRNMVFLKYHVQNLSSNMHERLHTGLFFDWDIGPNSQSDFAKYIDTLAMAICFDSTGSPKTQTRIGVLPLSVEYPVTYWGINNRDNDDSLTIGIYNGFSKAEKWKALSRGIVRPVSQITDVSFTIGNAVGDVAAGDSVVVGYALIAGESLAEIIASVPAARKMWDTLATAWDPTSVTDIALPRSELLRLGVHPNPLEGRRDVAVSLDVASQRAVRLKLFDMLGRQRADFGSVELLPGRTLRVLYLPEIPSGTYYLRAESPGLLRTVPLNIVR